MSNALLSKSYGQSQIVVLITKHINMNESIHDNIAHQQLKLLLLIVEKHHKCNEEHLDKNIGSGS